MAGIPHPHLSKLPWHRLRLRDPTGVPRSGIWLRSMSCFRWIPWRLRPRVDWGMIPYPSDGSWWKNWGSSSKNIQNIQNSPWGPVGWWLGRNWGSESSRMGGIRFLSNQSCRWFCGSLSPSWILLDCSSSASAETVQAWWKNPPRQTWVLGGRQLSPDVWDGESWRICKRLKRLLELLQHGRMCFES